MEHLSWVGQNHPLCYQTALQHSHRLFGPSQHLLQCLAAFGHMLKGKSPAWPIDQGAREFLRDAWDIPQDCGRRWTGEYLEEMKAGSPRALLWRLWSPRGIRRDGGDRSKDTRDAIVFFVKVDHPPFESWSQLHVVP